MKAIKQASVAEQREKALTLQRKSNRLPLSSKEDLRAAAAATANTWLLPQATGKLSRLAAAAAAGHLWHSHLCVCRGSLGLNSIYRLLLISIPAVIVYHRMLHACLAVDAVWFSATLSAAGCRSVAWTALIDSVGIPAHCRQLLGCSTCRAAMDVLLAAGIHAPTAGHAGLMLDTI